MTPAGLPKLRFCWAISRPKLEIILQSKRRCDNYFHQEKRTQVRPPPYLFHVQYFHIIFLQQCPQDVNIAAVIYSPQHTCILYGEHSLRRVILPSWVHTTQYTRLPKVLIQTLSSQMRGNECILHLPFFKTSPMISPLPKLPGSSPTP